MAALHIATMTEVDPANLALPKLSFGGRLRLYEGALDAARQVEGQNALAVVSFTPHKMYRTLGTR